METDSQQTTNVNGYAGDEVAPDAREFLGSRYLSKDDLDGPMVVYLQNVRPELLPDARRRKLVAEFRNEEKGLILNATNIKRLARIRYRPDLPMSCPSCRTPTHNGSLRRRRHLAA